MSCVALPCLRRCGLRSVCPLNELLVCIAIDNPQTIGATSATCLVTPRCQSPQRLKDGLFSPGPEERSNDIHEAIALVASYIMSSIWNVRDLKLWYQFLESRDCILA